MCGLINYSILVFNYLRQGKNLDAARDEAAEAMLGDDEIDVKATEVMLGMKRTIARSAVLPNDDLLKLSHKVYDFVRATRINARVVGDEEVVATQATQVVIFLARIMKYMGDKSHVIGGLIYNYISGKSFCICTIDRPLVSTIMNLILKGNLLFNLFENGAMVPEPRSLSQQQADIIPGLIERLVPNLNKAKIYNSLKNLYLAISPYDTASHILDKLPGFYGRFLEGVAAGGWTLWIYGSKVNSKEQQIAQRIEDIVKMCTIYNKNKGATHPEVVVGSVSSLLLTQSGESGIEPLRDNTELNKIFRENFGVEWENILNANIDEQQLQRTNESIKLGKLIFSDFSDDERELPTWISEKIGTFKSKETAWLGLVKEAEEAKAAEEAATGERRRSTRKKNIIQKAATTMYSDWGERALTFSSLFKDFPIVNGTGARNLKKISPPSSVPKNIRKFFSELLYQLNLGELTQWIGVNRDDWINFARELRKNAGFGVSSRKGLEPQLPYADWLVALWQLTHDIEFVNIDNLKNILTQNQINNKWGEYRKVYIGYIEELTECARILYKISNSLTSEELSSASA